MFFILWSKIAKQVRICLQFYILKLKNYWSFEYTDYSRTSCKSENRNKIYFSDSLHASLK